MYSAYVRGTILAFATSALGFPAVHDVRLDQRSSMPPPSQDPFYIPPADFSSAAPGSILRVRTAANSLTTIFNEAATVYQILYRTTDSQYRSSCAVTTLFTPQHPSNMSSSGHQALLSYQIPYNTVDNDASPSFALQSTSNLATGLILSDIQRALQEGWFVNVPDFEGPLASFGLGISEGHAVLDSVRAALSSGLGDLDPESTRYVMWGYSGGSIASEWAAELQPEYAPELEFSGMAIGGLVPNISALIESIDGTPASGLIVSLLLGMTSQDVAARDVLVESLKTTGSFDATSFLAARNMSCAETALTFANQLVLSSYFTTDGTSILTNPIVKSIIDDNWYMSYHGIPQMRMYIYKAIHDEYSPITLTDALVNQYCEIGVSVLYEKNVLGNHLDEYTNSDGSAWAWLEKAVKGDSRMDEGCTVRNVSIGMGVHGAFAPP
jgi:hypothetical protein